MSNSQSGNFTITATYADTNIYSTAVNTTTFPSNMKVTTLTAGSTSTANVGEKISVYGRITARNIGLQYANLTVTVGDKTYNVTTTKYGNYNLKVPILSAGNNLIVVTYKGTNIYTSSSASTGLIAKAN